MESYSYLLYIALILLSTKVLGLISRKLQMPQVVGSLIAGIILGPSLLNFISLDGDVGNVLTAMAEIGVILLMFSAGLGTDLKELKKNSVPAFIVASIGVIVPVIGGFFTYAFVFNIDYSNYLECIKALFIGVVLSATSVSITVETLRELGKLGGKVGTTILGAAVIDDILGIIVLTIVSSLQDTSISIVSVLLKIALYFVFIVAIYFVVHKFRKQIEAVGRKQRIILFGFAFCLILSYISETVFGIADITGAYFAGLILCNCKLSGYLNERTSQSIYMIFGPIFFASIGLKTTLSGMTAEIAVFSIALLIVAILSKIVGCGLGAKLCKFKNTDAVQIGVGMISRGEVALIVAQKGYQYGLVDSHLFAPIVLVVIITTLITPILLKVVMSDKFEARQVKSRKAILAHA